MAAYRRWAEHEHTGEARVDTSTSLEEVSRQWADGIEEPVTAETVAVEAREVLLVAMARAMIDIKTLIGELEHASDHTWTRRSIQAKLSGEAPMTLREYATIEHAIAKCRGNA